MTQPLHYVSAEYCFAPFIHQSVLPIFHFPLGRREHEGCPLKDQLKSKNKTCRKFRAELYLFFQCGAVAQLVERHVRNVEVEGSIPFRSTTLRSSFFGAAGGKPLNEDYTHLLRFIKAKGVPHSLKTDRAAAMKVGDGGYSV